MVDEKKRKTDRKVVKIFENGELEKKRDKLQKGLKTIEVEVTETTIKGTNKRTGREITIEVEK